jgi:hypothetical protein
MIFTHSHAMKKVVLLHLTPGIQRGSDCIGTVQGSGIIGRKVSRIIFYKTRQKKYTVSYFPYLSSVKKLFSFHALVNPKLSCNFASVKNDE